MLKDIKELLGIDEGDTKLDAKLTWIMNSAKARLKILLGGIEPPEALNYIITEVSVIRFNRIGSTVYRVDMSRKQSTKHVFVVSEVQ